MYCSTLQKCKECTNYHFKEQSKPSLSNSCQKLQMKTSFATEHVCLQISNLVQKHSFYSMKQEFLVLEKFWVSPFTPRDLFNNCVFTAFLRVFTWWEHETHLYAVVIIKKSILPINSPMYLDLGEGLHFRLQSYP